MGYETFLKLNGIVIPVSEISEKTEKISFLTSSKKSSVRTWEVTTAPLNPYDAKSLKGLLKGMGDHIGPYSTSTQWNNNITNFLTTDLGVVPTQGIATFRPLEGPNNTNAIAVEKGTTNLLTQNQASFETDLTGWTISTVGITASNPSDGGYHLSKYLKLVGSSGDTGWWMQTPSFITGINPGDVITFSWYEKHNINLTSVSGGSTYAPPAIIFYDSSGTEISRQTLTNLGPAKLNWHRHSITATAPTNTTQIKVRIGFDSPNINQYQFVCIDAVQVEKSSFPTSFAYTSRGTQNTYLPNFNVYNPNELSVFFKFNCLEYNIVEYIYQFLAPIYFGYSFSLLLNSRTFYIYLTSNDGIVHSYNTSFTISDNTWYNTGVIFNANASSLKFYVNGTLRLNTTVLSSLYGNCTGLRITPQSDSILISDFLVLPFAVSDNFASQITQISNSYNYRFPYFIVEGDATNNEQVTCIASLDSSEKMGIVDPQYGWVIGEKITFTLKEVELL